jgi:DNA-binding NtrC family response regulator
VANNIVILQNDPARARKLEASVRPLSAGVFTVTSIAELRELASRSRIQVGILDLDLVTFQDIGNLRKQLGIEILCIHRAPDDGMWTKALSAGAFDCCCDGDVPSICRAIRQSLAA